MCIHVSSLFLIVFRNIRNPHENFTAHYYTPAMSSTHLTYLNYGEAWIRVAAQFTTIALMSNIIFCALAPKRALLTVRVTLSRSLMVYLWYHAITSATSLPYNIYVVAKWHAPVSIKGINVPLYDPYWLFWTGIWPATYSSMNPVAVLILTLDRILVLSCHEWYKIRVQKLAVTFGALIIVALGVACVSLFFLELPLDLGKAVYCESFPCINLKNSSLPQLGVKLTSGVMAVVCMLWFFYLIKKYPGNLKINDRVVKITIIFEILFDVMPAFSLILFDGIIGVPTYKYLGQYASTSGSLDAAICGLYYSFVLLKQRNCNRKIIVSQTLALHSNTYQ